MAFSKAYREEVEEKLSACAMIRTKAMFGGVGIYEDEVFFALIDDDKLYFKVNETNLNDYESRDMEPWHIGDGYRELPSDVLDNPTELRIWIDKSIEVAKSKKKRR